MYVNYDLFKEFVNEREIHYHSKYKEIIEKLDERFDNGNKMIAFYPRNIIGRREHDHELLIFMDGGYLSIKVIDRNVATYEEIRSKIVKKRLTQPKYSNDPNSPTKLEIMYEDGSELLFNSFEDSNDDWMAYYGELIEHIYETI